MEMILLTFSGRRENSLGEEQEERGGDDEELIKTGAEGKKTSRPVTPFRNSLFPRQDGNVNEINLSLQLSRIVCEPNRLPSSAVDQNPPPVSLILKMMCKYLQEIGSV